MCGIVGMASSSALEANALICEMRDTMRHRGPDGAGEWQSRDRRVLLGHRRLAIIDLSDGGRQPMCDSTGTLALTFNGEIYNYQELRKELESCGHSFRSVSDSEVILESYRAWGMECVKRFNGMFAFALYDSLNQQLFLARDRAGEKPLFYRRCGATLVFASELKALMEDPSCPREVDLGALNAYLTYGYVPGAACILKGVFKLLQSHALTFNLATGSLHVWPYWELPPPPNGSPISAVELEEQLEALLLESVRLRLIADVPVGIMLSGGIDSSLVTALAARVCTRPVKTFTISFPDYRKFDEAPHARVVARHFGTDHVELAAEPATVDLLPTLARQYDEPMADSSMVPTYLVSRLIRKEATVALGGDGGDELFGGYLHYNWIRKQELARQFIPGPVRQLMSTCTEAVLPVGVRGRNYMLGFRRDIGYSIARINMFFDLNTRRRLLAPLGRAKDLQAYPEAYKTSMCDARQTPLQQATTVDFRTYLVDDILVKVDRASMLTSLEVRAPWLDHRIIEMAFGRVPDLLRATRAELKVLPRRLAARLLPRELDLKRKQGFALPLSSWFKGDWGRYIERILDESCLFDKATMATLIAGQKRGFANTHRLFALAMFELWRREYNVTI